MAARRLLILLLVLLGISILAATLAPQQEEDAQTPSQTTAGADADATPRADAPRSLKIDADRKPVDVLPLETGDQISLDVASKTADTVEIPAFGLIEAVDPAAPAHFELLLEQPGTFAIRLLGARRLAGRLEVSPAAPPAQASKKPAPSP